MRPWPPYSFGQPMPSQPSAPMRADDLAKDGPAALVQLGVERGAQLGREEVAVVVADLAAERVLLRREVEMHAVGWSVVCARRVESGAPLKMKHVLRSAHYAGIGPAMQRARAAMAARASSVVDVGWRERSDDRARRRRSGCAAGAAMEAAAGGRRIAARELARDGDAGCPWRTCTACRRRRSAAARSIGRTRRSSRRRPCRRGDRRRRRPRPDRGIAGGGADRGAGRGADDGADRGARRPPVVGAPRVRDRRATRPQGAAIACRRTRRPRSSCRVPGITMTFGPGGMWTQPASASPASEHQRRSRTASPSS